MTTSNTTKNRDVKLAKVNCGLCGFSLAGAELH
jgi:hypothetical protein